MKKYLSLLLVFPTILCAQPGVYNPNDSEPKSGVFILSDSEIPRLKVTNSQAAESHKTFLEIRRLGYYDCKDTCVNIKHLYDDIPLKSTSPAGLKVYSKITDMNLDFYFKGIPFIDKKDVIFFIPSGNADEDGTKAGGVNEAFIDSFFGRCNFSVSELKYRGVLLDKDDVTYIINHKITNRLDVSGNKEHGFVYVQEWYSDVFGYSLQCTYPTFEPKVSKAFIDLAKKIDSAVNLG